MPQRSNCGLFNILTNQAHALTQRQFSTRVTFLSQVFRIVTGAPSRKYIMGITISPTETADRIEEKLKTPGCEGGAIAAYDRFQLEFQQIAQSNSQPDTKRQLLSVTNELEKRGFLPAISVAWAAENFDAISARGNTSNPNLDMTDLGEYIRENSYPTTLLALSLKQNFHAVSASVQGDGAGISTFDAAQYLINWSLQLNGDGAAVACSTQ